MRKTRNQIYLILGLCAFAFCGSAFAGWENTYGGLYRDEVFSLAITNQKDYIMCGSTHSFSYELSDFYLIKVGSSGDELWQRIYGHGYGASVIQASDDGYIAVGELFVFPEPDDYYYLMKTNENGDSIWAHIYRIGDAGATSVAQTHDGGYTVVWDIPVSEMGFYLVKTDSLGDSIWTRTYSDTVIHCPRSLVQAFDEGCIIIGGVGADTHYDVGIVKIDNLGEVVWKQNFGDHGWDFGWFIDTTADGNFIITGQTSIYMTGSIVDLYLLKINDSGDTLWTRKIGGEDESDIGRCVRHTRDGGYIIAGYT